MQKSEMGYTKDQALKVNREEIEHYKAQLDRSETRYIITEEKEQEDGSIIVRVKNNIMIRQMYRSILVKRQTSSGRLVVS